MRRCLSYLLILLLPLLSACHSRQMREELQRVDSLNQNSIPLDTVATMQAVADYYDMWGDSNDRMAAHYLLGCVYRDRDDAPQALRCYRDATGYADSASADCDYRRLSRVYGQMAELFHHQRAPRLEIDAERKAVEYAWRAKDTLAAVTFLCRLGNPYHMLNDMDSCLLYNQQGMMLLRRYGYPQLALNYLPISIDICLRKKEYANARQAMDEFEKGFWFDKNGNIAKGRELYYKYKGEYFRGIGKLDSAEYFYRKLLTFKSDNDNAVAAYGGLLSFYQQTGTPDSIAKYAQLYCEASDSASFKHSADEITRAQALYNYEEHKRLADEQRRKANRYFLIAVSTIVGLLILGFSTYLYIKRQRRKQRQELIEFNFAYTELLSRYDKTSKEMQLYQQDWNLYRQEKEDEIKRLQFLISQYQESPSREEMWSLEQAMLNSPVVIQFHKLASHVTRPSLQQWQDFWKFVQSSLPDFRPVLERKTNALSEQEATVAVLTRLQFIPSEQAVLLDVSKQRITNLRATVNLKLFGEKGTKTLESNIMRLCSMKE